ncbi:Stk1 family PASTA domain-containing Ser/Thr kinase [Peptococcaceae bacterium 1198_IL3148]
MIGKLLGNRYEILEQLGGGGMAIVYKARDNFLNRLVTVKILRAEYVSDSDFVRRFRREAQAVARLSHPNIVNIHDVGQENDTQYLVMEYVDGDNLKNYIKHNQNLDLPTIVNIVMQICDALQHAHDNGIVHRDVKPQNILIAHNQRVKLTDFGIAFEAATGTISNTETVLGSVHYISPEQANGDTPGAQSDIYSLGVVLYEMLTGQLPFKGDGAVAVALKHIQEQPPLPSEIKPDIPKYLERVVIKAMEKDPARRYQTAKQFKQDLQQLDYTADLNDDFATQVLPGSAIAKAKESVPREGVNGKPPPAKAKPKADTRKIVLIASLLILSLLSGVLFAFYKYINVPEITVPNVLGYTEQEARDALTKVGLEAQVKEVKNEAEKGTVISQDPEPDAKAKQGRVVTLTVSLGPEMAKLPDVMGLPISEVRLALQNLDFEYTEEEVFSDKYEAGLVVDQDPGPGEYPKGTKVALEVSKGAEPKVHPMPTLVGLPLSQAEQKVAELNLILDEPTLTQASDEYMQGYVISQKPEPGAEITEGEGVSVVVSEGPGPAKRSAGITVEIDDDDKEHQLRINVSDARGEQDVYVKKHAPGEVVYENIEFYGRATIRVYIDNELRQQKVL